MQSYVLVVNADGDVLNMVIKRSPDGKFEGEDSLEGLIRLYVGQTCHACASCASCTALLWRVRTMGGKVAAC